MADETSYYSDEKGVRVTDKRVIIGSTTYSLANITSVSTKVEQPSKVWPTLFMALGVLVTWMALANKSFAAVPVGGIFGVMGYLWFRGIKPIWHLRIASASGEATPLQSINQQWVASIAQAINEAIMHRA